MKKNLLAVLLPVVAGVALSGTGFGLWVFNEKVSDKFVGASMQVEPAINFTSSALSIESLSVTNENGKFVGENALANKTIVFDQSDALASGTRWTVDITVGVTYEELLGALRTETNVTDGSGDYSAPSTVGGYELSELQAALNKYQVTVYSPLSDTPEKFDKDCKISSYLTHPADVTVNLKDFSSVPLPNGTFGGTEDTPETTKLTKTFKFTFAADQAYKDIKTAQLYKDFRSLVKTSTFNFTAEFAKAPSTQG